MTRERPGLAGSLRAGGGGGTGLPETCERHPLSGSRGFPAGRSRGRCAADASAAGAPCPRGWCSARDTAFSRRGGRVTAVTPLPSHSRPAGSPRPGKEPAPQSPRNSAGWPAWRPPSSLPDELPRGPCPVATLIAIRAGCCPGTWQEEGEECRERFRSQKGALESLNSRFQHWSPGQDGEGPPQRAFLPSAARVSLSWVWGAIRGAGAGESWDFLSFSLPRLT